MLDAMRQNAQSWAVKFLFALIILVFVFWGVGNMGDDQATVVAEVQDEQILIRDFQKAYQRTVENLRQEQPDISQNDFKQMQLKRQVLNDMITRQLLQREANDLGLTVSAQEVRNYVQQMPVFQNAEQQFDPGRYEQLLQANQLAPAQFEADLTRDLLTNKLEQSLKLPATVSEEQARDLFAFSQEKARMEYVLFSWQDAAEREPSQETVENYYQNNKKEFQRPAEMQMEYLLLTPEGLAEAQSVSEEEIKSYYSSNQEEFERQEQIHARHILFELPDGASEKQIEQAREQAQTIAKQLREGADFDTLAQEHSDGPSSAQGGDLGWFSRGEMVEAFETEAFALEPGEISDPVRTSSGFHVITVEDRKAPGTKELDEVKDSIRMQIGEDKAAQSMSDLLDEALDLILSGNSLQETAQTLDIPLRETSSFTQKQGPEDLELNEEQLETLFTLSEGEITETPILMEDGYLIAKQTDFSSAQARPLEDVRNQIETKLQRENGMEKAQDSAESFLDKLHNDSQNTDFETTTSDPFGRRGSIPGLGKNPRLVEAIFNARQGQWLDSPYKVQDGYIVARFAERIEPDMAQWQEQKSLWTNQLEQSRQQELFQAYLNQLRQQAEVKIVNPGVLEY